MTAKTVVAIGSIVAALGSASCLTFYDIAIETPINAKLDASLFQRVLVVGFTAGGSKGIDANTETARLLRSQLRTKTDLKVVDMDVVSLVDEVDRRHQQTGTTPAVDPQAPATDDAKNGEPKIKDAKDLEAYDEIFSDVSYWKKLGDEYQNPLIVTGSVLFTEAAKSGMVSKPKESFDSMGRRVVEEDRTFMDRKGYILTPKFIFIDGHTGQQLYSETLQEETYFPASQNTPALSSYFELMDKILPSFLTTLSNQKIRGTRTLLK